MNASNSFVALLLLCFFLLFLFGFFFSRPQLKQILSERSGVPKEQIKLIFLGNAMQDHDVSVFVTYSKVVFVLLRASFPQLLFASVIFFSN